MKKLFYLLLMLPFAFFASCSDDDDLPQVDLTITLSGVTQYENVFYAVQGDDTSDPTPETPSADTDEIPDDEPLPEGIITVDGLDAKSLTNQNAGVANAVYYIDGFVIRPSFNKPYACAINVNNLKEGTHTLSVTANVLQVDKSIANAALNYPLKVVGSEEELPAGAPEIGTYSITSRLQSK